MKAAAERFPDTSWGMVSRLISASKADFRAGLEILCGRYWKPAALYIRAAWRKSVEDAQDLTQAFFLWILEGEAIRRYAPERGSFRTFLKVLLRRFVLRDLASVGRQKRGGGIRKVRLADVHRPLAQTIADVRARTPEEVLDEEWTNLLLERALDRARARLVSEGKEVHLRVLEDYDLTGPERTPRYADIAARRGLTESQVRKYLYLARQVVRNELRRELASLTRDEKELEEEWNALFRSTGMGPAAP